MEPKSIEVDDWEVGDSRMERNGDRIDCWVQITIDSLTGTGPARYKELQSAFMECQPVNLKGAFDYDGPLNVVRRDTLVSLPGNVIFTLKSRNQQETGRPITM